MKKIKGIIESLLTRAYSESTSKRNLLDFKVGIVALMFGNLFAVFLFLALSEDIFVWFSVGTMAILVFLAISAHRRGQVGNFHYALTFLVTYIYGFVMFFNFNSSNGIVEFGLVYPVLSIFILKSFWGNLLIAMEFITGLSINYFVNPFEKGNMGTNATYIVIYIMFWAFGIVMDESRTFVDTKLIEQRDRLAFFANYDQLTNLYNRRSFYEKYEEVCNYNLTASSAAIIIIDLDDFKKINDTYGHNVGDIILSDTAKRISLVSRSTDICCRWGGEEFLIFALVDNAENGCLFAKKICDAIGKQPFDIDENTKLTVTASIGVTFTSDFRNIKIVELVRTADENLYQAKRNGKNCVYCGS